MGVYLNAKKPAALYKAETARPYFVDKTLLLNELFPLVEAGNQFICITRPRRFGKTVMANMIASFFGKEDSSSIFEKQKVANQTDAASVGNERYKRHLNQHDVIYIL